jgi:DNA-binding NtrC family response regulator
MADKKGRVLCVDDEPNILRSLTWLLQKEFDVTTALSGQAGLELVRVNDFDVVVSDQRMPGMMGSEFLCEVRKVSPRAMRILLTGYSDMQAILRSVNDGEVFRFVNKPWKISELPALVAEAALIAQTHPCPTVIAESGAHEVDLPPSHVETILLIDDEAMLADHMRRELGHGMNVVHATSIAEAIAVFSEHEVGIILSDTRVASVDTTALLRMLKKEHPEVVTVVYTGVTDASDVIGLINQGQIFRFIPKPVKAGILALVMKAAARKRQQLMANPELAKRHAVEDVCPDAKSAFVANIKLSAEKSPASANSSSFLQRFNGGLKRLFGG